MKRINYISFFSRPLSGAEIVEIGEKSFANNKRDGITGVLFCYDGIFYQILEGEDEKLNECYTRILRDPRHNNIFCLEIEENISERKYEEWHMKTIRLEESDDPLVIPIRSMLNSLAKTHSILQLYAPFEILDGIQKGQDPTTWEPFDSEKVILFSDIFSSTLLHEKLTPSEINEILTEYYEIAITIITNNGGTVSKLTGDGLMAYFDVRYIDIAIKSSLLIQKSLEKTRNNFSDKLLSFIYAGIGISSGIVRQGNIGSSDMKDYTILGDAVNKAARIESVTRTIGYNIVFDDTVAEKIIDKTLRIKNLGKYTPKGKTTEINLYTVDEHVVNLSKEGDDLLKRIEFYKSKK